MSTLPQPIATSVPGATPGIVPPTGTPDPSSQVTAMTQRIMQALAQAAQRKQFAGTPSPAAVPGQQDPNAARQIGMNTSNPHAWGMERFAAGIQTSIKNAVAKSKEKELLKAEGDWTYLQSGLNELYAAQASKDPQAIASAQAKVDVVLTDPKKLKQMAKALNQDWLNPEKTTVYGEALKKVNAKTQQADTQQQQQQQQKQQAATGLKAMFQKLIQNQKQPQLSPDQQKQMGAEVQAKAPTTTTPGPAIKDQLEAAKGILDLEQASKAAREQYQFIPASDGTVWAINKANPKDAFQVKDSAGQDLKGAAKGKNGPMVVQGIPVGVYRNGKPLTPDSPDWTKEDQNVLDTSLRGSTLKQQLKIDPIIGDQIGNPPDPKDYAKGNKDPQYAAALKKYGEEAEAIKNRMAGASGTARAKAMNEYRPVQAMDADGNVYYTTAKNAIEQGLAGASEGVKLKPREAQINDIQVASGKAREAINALDKPFDTEQIAKLHLAMTTPDDTVANAELTTLATQNLTEKQQDFVIWVKQLNERAMSLRNVAGMGTGAQDLRSAIRDMIPGLRSGSKEMMNKQLDAFDNQVRILKGGIAHPGKAAKPADKAKDPMGILD
jgi:hypothetical protein